MQSTQAPAAQLKPLYQLMPSHLRHHHVVRTRSMVSSWGRSFGALPHRSSSARIPMPLDSGEPRNEPQPHLQPATGSRFRSRASAGERCQSEPRVPSSAGNTGSTPRPGRGRLHLTRPPACSAIPYTVESPSPRPPPCFVVKKGSKILPWVASSMPTPVSLTLS